MNLSTVKWAQWDKTQSRELLGLFICAQLLHTILHRTDLIIFPLILQTITRAPMMTIWWNEGHHCIEYHEKVSVYFTVIKTKTTKVQLLCTSQLHLCAFSPNYNIHCWKCSRLVHLLPYECTIHNENTVSFSHIRVNLLRRILLCCNVHCWSCCWYWTRFIWYSCHCFCCCHWAACICSAVNLFFSSASAANFYINSPPSLLTNTSPIIVS